MPSRDIEKLILRAIAAAGALQVGYFITDNSTALQNLIKALVGVPCDASWGEFSEAFWALVARRSVYVGGARSFGQCTVWLTEKGRKALTDELWRGESAENLRTILENPRQFYVYKLQEFDKRLRVAKAEIPQEFSENLELNITTVLQLIRLTRNDAGHPTGKPIDRQDCHQNLVVYANAHQKLHRLQGFFEGQN